jgi:Restriction Endonuclease associating with ARP
MNAYADQLVVRMNAYAHERFDAALLETGSDPHRPPVFLAEHATSNLLLPPDPDLASAVVKMVPVPARHRWFRSMKSSQALTQSVFGALAATGHLAVLGALTAECGRPAFTETPNLLNMTLEQPVNWLGEPRPTSIDVCFESPRYRIAVECKLSESLFGACSRPKLPRDDPSHCDGTYTVQDGRRTRCALTEIGVQYWHHAPAVLHWNPDVDHVPCPLARTYQLVTMKRPAPW